MIIESFDIVFYTFSFIVPGYIIEEVVSSIIPLKKQEEGIKIIRCLAYSVLNYAIWFSWGIKLLQTIVPSNSVKFWVLLALLVLITGFITGFIIGFIRAKGFIRDIFNRCFGKFGLNLTHPIPSAWDYVFKNFTEGAWVTIKTDEDTFVRGLFYKNSFASSDENYRDFYFEQVYTMGEDGTWSKTPRTKGMWLSPDAIKHIEFYEIKEKEEKENERKEIAGQ